MNKRRKNHMTNKKEQEGICPLCQHKIKYNGEDIKNEYNGGMYPWTCPHCEAHGYETYTRQFTGHISVSQ